MTDNKKLVRSAAMRLFHLGGLAGRVGLSLAGNTVAGLFKDPNSRESFRSDVLVKNALRVKETLGSLKGVPMKIGQMISLHEKLLPKEVVSILKTLQQKAPAVCFSDMQKMMQDELGKNFSRIKKIDEIAIAAASIGQVHRAVLADGREIALKVQYPGIDEVIRADMKNLKGVLKLLFSMFSEMDMDLVWQELNERLIEELDYEKEAANMKRAAALFRDDSRIVIPGVVDELTTRHILAMDLVCGIPPEEVSGFGIQQELRNAWGEAIVSFLLKGLFKHRFLHADPNMANFGFCHDGRIIVYDFGCMKEIPEALCKSYVLILSALLDHDYTKIPGLLMDMGVHRKDGLPVSWDIVADFAPIFQEILDPDRHYVFGSDHDFYARFQDLARKHMAESMTIVFPKDIIFIDRTFGGHFGNLCMLKASADWRSILLKYMDSVQGDLK